MGRGYARIVPQVAPWEKPVGLSVTCFPRRVFFAMMVLCVGAGFMRMAVARSVQFAVFATFIGVLGSFTLDAGPAKTTVQAHSLASQSLANQVKEIGEPFLRNYTSREYGAFYQNWCLARDPRGLIYIGNYGVLQYDGARWRLIPTEKGTLVRSLAVDASGRVFVGAIGEMGYLAADEVGNLRYVSLLDRLEAADRNFSEIWSIQVVENRVYFQAFQRLFCLQENRFRTWKPEIRFQMTSSAWGRLYVNEEGCGLQVMEGDLLRPVKGGECFARMKVRSVLPRELPGGDKAVLVCTQEHGIFLVSDAGVIPFVTQVDAALRKDQLYQGMVLPDGSLVMATLLGGLVHLTPDGRLLARIDKSDGLQSDSMKALLLDPQGGVWAALQKGICRVEYPSPLSRYSESNGLLGTVFSMYRHQGVLYVGTDRGLFHLSTQGPGKPRFFHVPGIEKAIWWIGNWGESLLTATVDGLFELKDGRMVLLWKSPTVVFSLYRSKRNPNRLYVGKQNGLTSLRREEGRWVEEGQVPDLPIQVRSIHETPEGSLWVGTTVHGVYRFEFPTGIQHPKVTHYGVDQGLPSLAHTNVFWIGGELKASSHSGIYHYRSDLDRFEPDPRFVGLFLEGLRWVYGLKEDAQGRVWMHSCDEVRAINESGVAVLGSDGNYRWEGNPFVRFSGSWVECLLPESDGCVWFGGADGLVRFDSTMTKSFRDSYKTLLRAIHAGDTHQIYGGNLLSGQSHQPVPAVPYAWNRFRFDFAAVSLEQEDANRYQVLLEGYDAAWSPWQPEPFKDYTNLAEGNYRFRVRARNLYGVIGEEDTFSFRILPPWYRTWWAYLLMVSAVGASGWVLFRWRMAALRARNLELQIKVLERTKDLAARNQELEALDQTVQAVNREMALQPLLEAILQQSLRQVPQAEKGTVLIQEESSGLFRVQASVGYDSGLLDSIAFTEDEIVTRYTRDAELLQQGVFLVKNLECAAGWEKLGALPIPSCLLAMSLSFEDRVVGFLVLESFSDPGAFRDTDMDRLLRFRQHAITALMKARMFDRLEASSFQLQELNAQKNQFLGIVAHDLRNPLNGIVLAAQLLDGEEDLEEVWRTARNIQREGMDMSALIGRFLDVVAIESGAIKAELALHDLSALARHVMERHENRANEKGIGMDFLAPAEPVSAYMDVKFMKETLDNLVSNAVKFSPRQTKITVRVEMLDKQARVSVEDQGPGLTLEDRKKLFGRFSRLSAQPTGGEKSTGLGLSIVKHMVEAMDGRIWVDSEPGHGAAFRVELPVQPT